MNLRDTYDRIAEDWARDHDNDTWWQTGTDLFLSLLPAGTTVLDVGCGAGVKTRYIAGKGHQVLGIDFSGKMIEIARRSNPEQRFETLDMREAAALGRTFDGIFAQASLLHIPKAETPAVLATLVSVLNPGGLLYVAVKGMRADGIEEENKIENDYGYEYERFFSYFTMDEMRGYLRDLGMEIVWEGDALPEATRWVQVVARKT